VSLFFDTFERCSKIDLILGCGVSNHHVWAPCRTIRNRFHGCVWDVV